MMCQLRLLKWMGNKLLEDKLVLNGQNDAVCIPTFMPIIPDLFFFSRLTYLSLHNPLHPPKPPLPSPPIFLYRRLLTTRCLVSGGVDGFFSSDDLISTRKSTFDQGFTVITNMLR
ncbi:hypothetical protein Ahy_B05g079730 [Arachis hypogaea]|uniref:Uncharacterized protein n=1 Tax=Arachis hypogaea TaxID=3818 RepID=A0A444ZAR8_ARAHY|nr:hypothetical protein Ahy_B05g079730 [Arachis hypogaea]